MFWVKMAESVFQEAPSGMSEFYWYGLMDDRLDLVRPDASEKMRGSGSNRIGSSRVVGSLAELGVRICRPWRDFADMAVLWDGTAGVRS